jgi:DNA replication protein DnaC
MAGPDERAPGGAHALAPAPSTRDLGALSPYAASGRGPPPPRWARRTRPATARERAVISNPSRTTEVTMLNAQTLEQLQALKLTAMAATWTTQPQNAELTALSFDERFALLVDAEWRARENKRLGRALRDAKLKLPHASIEAIDDPARRELDKAVIRQLATCRWVDEPQPVLISGAPGVGKTFIACALGNQACRKGYRARYWRASRLYHACALARADGTYGRFLGQLARVDVLVLDDWALTPLQDPERRDILEILEDRSGTRATVVTSQLPPKRWHDYVADPTLADAICDRLLHNAHRIVLQGPSRRKEEKLDS